MHGQHVLIWIESSRKCEFLMVESFDVIYSSWVNIFFAVHKKNVRKQTLHSPVKSQ